MRHRMRDSRACCGRPSAGRSNSCPATNALSDGAPATERSSAAQQILSSELARSTDAAELQLTRPIGGSIADKPESIHDTSCRASGACTAVTPRGSPAGRQRAGNRSAVSVSAPAAIRGAMDRTRGGSNARPWRAAPPDRKGGRLVEALTLGRNCRSLSACRDHHRDLSWTRSSASPRVCAKAEQGRKGVIDLAVSAGVENKQFEPHGARRRPQVF